MQVQAPKQARSVATRLRILDAAIDVLVECGYAGTTTPEVCRRAEISQGALFKHFPAKTDLLGATVEHLFGRMVEDFAGTFAAVPRKGDRIRKALELLWRTFQEPRLQAAFELYVAARTDAGLREVLVPVLENHRENIRVEARRLFPEAAAGGARFDQTVDSMMATLQGAALTAELVPNPGDPKLYLEILERFARREFMAIS